MDRSHIKFYCKEIKINKMLLTYGDELQQEQAKKNLLELRGRLLFELRQMNKEQEDDNCE